MTGYAQSSEHVIGALRGPADFLGEQTRKRRLEVTLGALSLIAILSGCLLLVVVAVVFPVASPVKLSTAWPCRSAAGIPGPNCAGLSGIATGSTLGNCHGAY